MSKSSLLNRLFNLYYNLGCILHQQGRLSDAADSYYKAIAVQENWVEPSVESEVKSNRFKVLNNLACLLIQRGDWREAADICQQAIDLQPNHASLHNNLGQALLRLDPSAAVLSYRRAIELQPNLATAYHNLGVAFQHQFQHQQAIDAFSRALELKPEHLATHSYAAMSWLALGQTQQMIASFRSAIMPYTRLVQAYCYQVEQLDSIDELSLARRNCGRFLQALLNNQEDEVCDALAQTYLHWANIFSTYGGDEQYQYAESYYQRALHLQPQNSEILVKLVYFLMQQERWNAAVFTAEAALTVCSSPQFYWQLGYTLEQEQHFSAAIHYYQQALSHQSTESSFSALSPLRFFESKAKSSHLVEAKTDSLDTDLGVKADRNPLPLHSSKGDALVAGFYQTTQQWANEKQLARDAYIPLRSIANQVVACPVVPSEDLPDLGDCQNDASCAGINCAACLQQIRDWFNPSQISKQLYALPDAEATLPIAPSPLFVANIPEGRAWVVPQKNVWMVCNAIAVLSSDHHLLSDISRAYPAHLPGCQNPSPKAHRIFTQSSFPALETIDGTVAVLSNLSGNTYFHWIVDILPRIELLRQSGIDLLTIDWFLVNGGEHAFQRETLAKLGIPSEKILSSDRHPHLQATNLVVPSFPSHFGWLEPWALSFLRREFLSPSVEEGLPDLKEHGLIELLDGASEWPTRIYISRADANYRHVLNEPEVLDRLRPFGFVSIELDRLSFQTQVALFAHAEIVVAPHGSGLTNIAFCRPGTTILEFVSPHYIRYYFWVISHHLKLQHYFLVGEMMPCHSIRELMYQNPLIEDIWVNLDALDVMLEKLNCLVSMHC